MVNEGFVFKLPLERPRLLFTLVGLVIMHLMLYTNSYLGSGHYASQAIEFAAFGLALFLAHLPWTKRFESRFELRKFSPKQKKESFAFRISDIQMQQLYNGLIKYDLLCSDKTSLEAFKNVLTEDWNSHDSKIYLNLDGPSSREFYDHLVTTFPKNSSTLKNFFETSGVIARTNGKPYKYNTIKNAPTRTPVSKHHEALINVFHRLR